LTVWIFAVPLRRRQQEAYEVLSRLLQDTYKVFTKVLQSPYKIDDS